METQNIIDYLDKEARCKKYKKKIKVGFFSELAKIALHRRSLEGIGKLLREVSAKKSSAERTTKLMAKNPAGYSLGDAIDAGNRLSKLEKRFSNLQQIYERDKQVANLIG